MARDKSLLYLGTNRFVAALDPKTGQEVWRTRLKSSTGGVVSLVIRDEFLFAGCNGRVYCLDKRRGDILWENDLPRMGYSAVVLALEGATASQSDALIAAVEAAQAAAAGA